MKKTYCDQCGREIDTRHSKSYQVTLLTVKRRNCGGGC